MTRALSRLLLLAGGLSLCLLQLAPAAVRAQTASPSNAGGNSGNNNTGSSSTPIGTINFTTTTVTSPVPNVTVGQNGTIAISPALQVQAQTAVVSAAISSVQGTGVLSNVVASAAVTALPFVTPDTAVKITIKPSFSTQQSAATIGQLSQLTPVPSATGQSIEILNPNGSSGTITLTEVGLSVTGLNGTVDPQQGSTLIPSGGSVSPELIKLVAIGIASGMTAGTLNLAVQMLSLGATSLQAAQLGLSLQTLLAAGDSGSSQNQGTVANFTSLNNAINSFNAIVASPGVNPVTLQNSTGFMAVRSLLQSSYQALRGVTG